MWATLLDRLTTTPAPSEIGRPVQLLRAAGLTAENEVASPTVPTLAHRNYYVDADAKHHLPHVDLA
jgi:hypothetical protein